VKQGKLVDIHRDAIGERHDDRENHRSRSHNGCTNQHRLRSSLERISGAVVFFQKLFRRAQSARQR